MSVFFVRTGFGFSTAREAAAGGFSEAGALAWSVVVSETFKRGFLAARLAGEGAGTASALGRSLEVRAAVGAFGLRFAGRLGAVVEAS